MQKVKDRFVKLLLQLRGGTSLTKSAALSNNPRETRKAEFNPISQCFSGVILSAARLL